MILITGGAGYIGAHAAKKLAAKGYAPLVLDNLSCGHREFVRWGGLIAGDLADAGLLRTIFERYPVEAVMHFAGSAYVGESVADPAKYYRNNVANTLNLLEAVQAAGVKSFVFSSSCAAYGIPETVPITEEHLLNPINPYGRSKMVVERMLHDFSSACGLRYVSLRYFNAAGADPEGDIGEWHTPETHLIPLALEVAAGRRETLDVFGTDYHTPDGTCIRDYIHVCDLASAHVKALEYLLAGGGSIALNLGNGHGFSVREVVASVERVTGRGVPVRATTRRPGDPPVLVGSAALAQQILGWIPAYGSLESIIATAWNWHSRLQQSVGAPE